MSFDWSEHAECLTGCTAGCDCIAPCETDRAAMITEGGRLEHVVSSLIETLKTIESLECHTCEAQGIAGGALGYAPFHTEHGLMVRQLQAENARLREALVELTLSGEWLAFGNLPDEDREPKPIAEALAFAHSALEVKP